MSTNLIKARPTTYDGIDMRSRLEARYAAWLDREHIRWEYEPQCYATSEGQYLPDFRLHDIIILGSPRTLYIDTKPTAALTAATLTRMQIIHQSEPDAWLGVETPDVEREGSTIAVCAPDDLGAVCMFLSWARCAPLWRPELVRAMTQRRWSAT